VFLPIDSNKEKTMPLKRCTTTEDGNTKNGWKYGDQGKCYTGPGAKKKAINQGVAISKNSGEPFKADLHEVSRSEELIDDLERTIMDNRSREASSDTTTGLPG
jgi:hypothetical protein